MKTRTRERGRRTPATRAQLDRGFQRRLGLVVALLILLGLVLSIAGCAGGSSATTGASTATTSKGAADQHLAYAVGDDTQPGTEKVSARLASLVPLPSEGLELFLYLGDVRTSGSTKDFARYDAIWGSGGRDLRAKTASLIGNHETGNRKKGWVPYWSGKLITPWPGSLTQADPPYYTVKLGLWKFIILDTNNPIPAGSPQYAFLVAQLQEPGYHCIVCGHTPRWSNGTHGDSSALDPVWKALCQYGAVAYLSGHDHGSQIQPRRDANGNAVKSGGCIQIVAAAGGAPLYALVTSPGHSAAEWRDDTHFALLRLTLGENEFRAEFIGQDGTVLHSEAFAANKAR